jgi:hypothetical protein
VFRSKKGIQEQRRLWGQIQAFKNNPLIRTTFQGHTLNNPKTSHWDTTLKDSTALSQYHHDAVHRLYITMHPGGTKNMFKS